MCDSENATTLPKVNSKPSRRTVLKAGAGAPAVPIVWTTRQLAGPGDRWSVTISTAQAGPYALEVHDSMSRTGWPRIVLWTVESDGKRLGEGVLDSTDDGKAAAESKARRLLAGAGAAVAAPAMAAPHPDAELLKAWSDYIAIRKAHQEAPINLTGEEEEELFYRPMTALEDKIAALPAHTHHGYAVKARMALYWSLFDWNEDPLKLATHQKGPLPDEDRLGYELLLLWKMVEQAESMGGAA